MSPLIVECGEERPFVVWLYEIHKSLYFYILVRHSIFGLASAETAFNLHEVQGSGPSIEAEYPSYAR